jgi:hypothetical protein
VSQITDSDLITEDKVDFLLSEAKEQLNATVADAEALTKSGIYLLGGLLTVITALVGVIAAQFNGTKSFSEQRWEIMLPLLVTTLYTFADAAMIMWTALSSKDLEHGGNTPNNLATQELFQLEAEARLIKFSEALSYQERIDQNHQRNEEIGITINRGIKLACAAPLIYLVLLLAAYFIAPSSFRP